MINGDATQVDLPSGQRSGLAVVEEILTGIDGIAFIHLGGARRGAPQIVQDIVEAYGRYAQQRARGRELIAR